MPRVLYQVYNHRAGGPQARGRGDYKLVGISSVSIIGLPTLVAPIN